MPYLKHCISTSQKCAGIDTTTHESFIATGSVIMEHIRDEHTNIILLCIDGLLIWVHNYYSIYSVFI